MEKDKLKKEKIFVESGNIGANLLEIVGGIITATTGDPFYLILGGLLDVGTYIHTHSMEADRRDLFAYSRIKYTKFPPYRWLPLTERTISKS